MRKVTLVTILTVLIAGPSIQAQPVRCTATRDVWISAMGKEKDFNMGAAKTTKLKVWQEFGLVDFDLSALKGKEVTSAYLYIKPVSRGKVALNAGSDLKWLTVSTVSHAWVEGKSPRYAHDPEGHGATFNESSYKTADWGWKGAKAWNVMLGNGNTVRIDGVLTAEGSWLKIKIDPSLVRALVAGASHGLMIMDGSTSVRINSTIATREGGNAPYLMVVSRPLDRSQGSVTQLAVMAEPNWATEEFGAVTVSLRVPAGAFAYDVKVNGKALERWQVPFATKPGAKQGFRILDLPAGADLVVEVSAVDRAGNASAYVEAKGVTSSVLTVPKLPASPFKPAGGKPRQLGEVMVWAVPEITKVDPVDGKVLNEKIVGDVRSANAVWDGATGMVRLASARGEIVSFQLVLEGEVKDCSVTVSDLAGAGTISSKGVKLWRNWYVDRQSEYAIPWKGTVSCPSMDNKIKGQKLQAVTVDLHVPIGTAAGDYKGTVTLKAGGQTLDLPLAVKVYDVVIPEEIHFNPELNCYGGPGTAGSAKFRDSFRLAHYNRCTINRVPYSQNGRVKDDYIPKVDSRGRVTNWSKFDANLGGLLDGSWFADNPRKSVPVPTFYLPLFEGWPKNFRDHYNPGPGVPTNVKDQVEKLKHDVMAKPIEEAIDKQYKDAFVNCTADFVKHAKEKGWNKTLFEMYLNNKPNYGYTLWTLDEPFEYLDWAALNFFGELFKKGVNDPAVYTRQWHEDLYVKGLAKMNRDRPTFLYRGDISRPMWQGNVSDQNMTIMYSGGVFVQVPRLLRDTKDRAPMVLYGYGSANAFGRNNWESAAWCLRTFAGNGDGVLPWQSLGNVNALEKGDRAGSGNSLIIDTGDKFGHAVASFRVHALRRGAQDCELLRLLQLKNGWSREHMGLLVSQKVPLTSRFSQKFTDEAAAITFGTLTSQGFCEMKEGVLQLLTQ